MFVFVCSELLRGLEQIQQDLRATHLDDLEEECKKAALIALKSYNQAQVRKEKKQRKRAEGIVIIFGHLFCFFKF